MPLLFQLIQKGYALLDKIRIAPTRVFFAHKWAKKTLSPRKVFFATHMSRQKMI